MKRVFSRHMSLRRRGRYVQLSCSDSQLHCDKTQGDDAKEGDCRRPEDSKTSKHGVSQQRRPWYKFLRRKNRGESESTLVRGEAMFTAEPPEDFEIATEASPCHDVEDTCPGHATLTRSANGSGMDVRNVDTTGMLLAHETSFVSMHTPNLSDLRPPYLGGRRFAICEELEREMVMNDGVNLRKSRKNLVIRQVLHDLLLL